MEMATLSNENPRELLSPEAVPVLRSYASTDMQSTDAEDLPSTVDMDFLKEPTISFSMDAPSHMTAWRSTAEPRPKPKSTHELTSRKDLKQTSNCHDRGPNLSEDSSEDSDSSSSSSDDESKSGSGSGSSSSNSGSSSSSGDSSGSSSSSSSDSDESDSQSIRSTSSHSLSNNDPLMSMPHGDNFLTLSSKKSTASNSSTTSSKSRGRRRDKILQKSPQFSVTHNYEPGSLKLKIAALKIPNRQDQVATVSSSSSSASSSRSASSSSSLPSSSATTSRPLPTSVLSNNCNNINDNIGTSLNITCKNPIALNSAISNADLNEANNGDLKNSTTTTTTMSTSDYQSTKPNPRAVSMCNEKSKEANISSNNDNIKDNKKEEEKNPPIRRSKRTKSINETPEGSGIAVVSSNNDNKRKARPKEKNIAGGVSASKSLPENMVNRVHLPFLPPKNNLNAIRIPNPQRQQFLSTTLQKMHKSPSKNDKLGQNYGTINKSYNPNNNDLNLNQRIVSETVLNLSNRSSSSSSSSYNVNVPGESNQIKSATNNMVSSHHSNNHNRNLTSLGSYQLPPQLTIFHHPTTQHVSESVLMLTKNSDLTIFPISNPMLHNANSGSSNNNSRPNISISHHGAAKNVQAFNDNGNNKNNNNLSITSMISSSSAVPPVRASRRISAQRKSMDAKAEDLKSLENSESSKGAVELTLESGKSIPFMPSTSSSITKKHSPITNYKSHLLEKFTEAMSSGKGPPKFGDVSIEPIVPKSIHSIQSPSLAIPSSCIKNYHTNIRSDKSNRVSQYSSNFSGKDIVLDGTTISLVTRGNDGQITNTTATTSTLQPRPKKSLVSVKVNGNVQKEKEIQQLPLPAGNNNNNNSINPKTKKAKQNKLSIFAPFANSNRNKLQNKINEISNALSQVKANTNLSDVNTNKNVKTSAKISSESTAKPSKRNAAKTTTTRVPFLETQTVEYRNVLPEYLPHSRIQNSKQSLQSFVPLAYSNNISSSTVNSTNRAITSVMKQSNQQYQYQMAPMKTKAAKKYIPGDELVIPQIGKGVVKQRTGRKKKAKAKSKKSRSKDKTSLKYLKAIEELCLLFEKQCFLQKSSTKRKQKQPNQIAHHFIFRKAQFRNTFTPLIPNDQIPPPSRDVLLISRHKPKAANSLHKNVTLNKNDKSYLSSTSSLVSMKKKQSFSSNSTKDRDSGSESTISSESCGSDLQRLPLKKRHHHKSTTSSSASLANTIEILKRNLLRERKKSASRMDVNVKHKFAATNLPQWKFPRFSEYSPFFHDLGMGLRDSKGTKTFAHFAAPKTTARATKNFTGRTTGGEIKASKFTQQQRPFSSSSSAFVTSTIEHKANSSNNNNNINSTKTSISFLTPQGTNIREGTRRSSRKIPKTVPTMSEIIPPPSSLPITFVNSIDINANNANKSKCRNKLGEKSKSKEPTQKNIQVPIPSIVLKSAAFAKEREQREYDKRLKEGATLSHTPPSTSSKQKTDIIIEPFEIIEVIHVKESYGDQEEASNIIDDYNLMELMTMPIDKNSSSIGHTHSNVSTPTGSTSSNPKKRRKINKTGFPTSRKKKRFESGNRPSKFVGEILTPQSSSCVEESGNESVERRDITSLVQSFNKSNFNRIKSANNSINNSNYKNDNSSNNNPIKRASSPKSKTTSKKTEVLKENVEIELELEEDETSLFQSSFIERADVQKRRSIDGLSSLVESGELNIPGICPGLLNVHDPPLLLPTKANYLPAGLLSNHYKKTGGNSVQRTNSFSFSVPQTRININSPSKNEKSSERKFSPNRKLFSKAAATTTTTITNSILPPPVYCQEFLFRKPRRDYLLPFDVWCFGVINSRNALEQYSDNVGKEEIGTSSLKKGQDRKAKSTGNNSKSNHNSSIGNESTSSVSPIATKQVKVPMPEVIPASWKFKKIRSNVYFGQIKPPFDMNSDHLCSCPDGEEKCTTDNCLNRQKCPSTNAVFAECPASCGENCRNRRIQKHEHAKDVKRFMTPNKGYGVKTTQPIKRGELILEYVGEVVPDAVFKTRMHTTYSKDTHHYCLHLDGGMVIDGHRMGGECRFVNHSCDPNCEMQKWSVNGISRMALFALRDIGNDEELTYDYNFSLFNPAEGQPCYCGSRNCRGVIGGRRRGKNDRSSPSRRKSSIIKALGLQNMISGATMDPTILDKMRPLSKTNRLFIQTHHIFLMRNYEKIRLGKREKKQVTTNEKLEKLMTPWAARFKVGSNKNKPLIVNNDDYELQEMAKVASVLYELFLTVTTAKEGTNLLCEPFMELPSRRKCPELYDKVQQPLDLTFVGKKILRGEYMNIQALETDIATVLSSFAITLQKEKPAIERTVEKVKRIYMNAKAKAVTALEPFIVTNDAKNSVKFVSAAFNKSDEVIRCICGTYNLEGCMVQCEKCLVWQHGDCVGFEEPSDGGDGQQEIHKDKKKKSSSGKANRQNNSNLRKFSSHGSSSSRKKNNSVGQVEFGDDLISVQEELMVLDVKEGESLTVDPPISSTENITTSEPYYCERCSPRYIDPEVPIKYIDKEPDKTHYLTLVRDDGLVIRKSDTVYILRDPPPVNTMEGNGNEVGKNNEQACASNSSLSLKSTRNQGVSYKTAGPLNPESCDIFRVEGLWKKDDGSRWVFGHHFLRPNETFHEPNRRFYPNEILKAPHTEVIPIDAVHGQCWVMDSSTYCKGRPIGYTGEEHLYICELRVDKRARSFTKTKVLGLCMEPFAFTYFETKLKIQRNIHPHGPPSPDFKPKPFMTTGGIISTETTKNRKAGVKVNKKGKSLVNNQKLRNERRERVNNVLDRLHGRKPNFIVNNATSSLTLSVDLKGRKNQTKLFSLA